MAIDSISKPMSSDQDGPAGISGELIMSDVDCMGYPNQELLAATWNKELIAQIGEAEAVKPPYWDIPTYTPPSSTSHKIPDGDDA